MITFADFIFLCWALLLGYWIINYRNVKPTLRRGEGFWRLRIIAIIMVIGVIGVLRKFNLVSPCEVTLIGCHIGLGEMQNTPFILGIVGSILKILT